MKIVILIVSLVLILSGCGTTYITASDPRVSIIVRDQVRGKGIAKITRVGPPQKLVLTATYLDTEVGSTVIRRRFDFFTILVSAYTYGTGLLFSWRYPSNINIAVDYHLMETLTGSVSVWDRPGNTDSHWNKPPPADW